MAIEYNLRREQFVNPIYDNREIEGSRALLNNTNTIFMQAPELPLTLENLKSISDARTNVLDQIISSLQATDENLTVMRNKYMTMIGDGRMSPYDLFRDLQYSSVLKTWLQDETSFWEQQIRCLPVEFDPGQGDAMTRWFAAFLAKEWRCWEVYDKTDHPEAQSLRVALADLCSYAEETVVSVGPSF